jgi:hypothetical protein
MNTALLHSLPDAAPVSLAGPLPHLATPLPSHGPARSRAAAVAEAVAAASRDAAFRSLVVEADAMRDQRQWGKAEHLYCRALGLHPLHPGYRVQYGHALKEQRKCADAEVAYRSAWALGEAGEDLRQHILHVVAAQGDAALGDAAPFLPAPRLAPAHPLDERPWQGDVELGCALLLHRAPDLMADTLPLLRGAPTRRAMLLTLAQRPEAATANRDLMLLLAEEG